MQGHPVVTSDEHKAGQVVDVQGEFLIVEFGTLRKQKHVLPKAFATQREGEETVAATVTWDILKDSPTVGGDGSVDSEAVAEHYGLADHFENESAPASGLGDTIPGSDPAYGAEEAARAGGVSTAEQERVAIREQLSDTSGAAEAPHTSPSITGGDRYRDAPGAKPAGEE